MCMARYLLCGAGVDEWSLGGAGVRAVADLQLSVHGLPQLLHKHIMDPTLHQETVGAHTRLQEIWREATRGALAGGRIGKFDIRPG